MCSVDGGPDYEVPIIGESSFVDYRLSTTELDYGEIPYNESSSKEFYIENVGKVPFEFSINLSTVSRPGIIECNHMNGKVIAGDRFRVVVKFFPGVPDNINEMLLVECGHFPAARFKVRAVGIYPGCLLSFPRAAEDDYQRRLDQAKVRLEQGEVTYSAKFAGGDAIKNMPPWPPKIPEKEKAANKEPEVMEMETEADREYLCEKIKEKLKHASGHGSASPAPGGSAAPASTSRDARAEGAAAGSKPKGDATKPQASGKKTTGPKAPSAPAEGQDAIAPLNVSGPVNLENICIATYICDFGNVVVGSTKRKFFRLTNVGRLPVTFNFDKRVLTQAGINVEPDKVQKVMPNASTVFTVTYTTRKSARQGKQRYTLPLDVKGGPQYSIEFIANLTIPEFVMSAESLDFGKVCVQTRKTIKIRFENQKEVACTWKYSATPDIATASKEGERFQIMPQAGTLLPGQRQSVDVMFTPNSDKPFQQKLTFRCNDNLKPFILFVKGQGIHYQVELVPETLHLGPVLPYDTSAVQWIEIRNPMEQAIEVVSQDFDKQYVEEEEILKRLDHFNAAQPEPLYLPLRAPGGEFWPSLRE